jgi:extracellular factor (EF) 3-hydroxypalmitic acid methyl ester biosynthesis protein
LPKQEYRLYQLYIQKELYKYVGLTPFNKHIYEQPLGYPGDYIMMNYLYEDGYVGDSTFDILIHRYTCSTPMARANINRKHFFKKHIKEYIVKSKGHARIASVACGPAQEAIEIISGDKDASECTFSFFDFEPRALDFIKTEIIGHHLKKEPKTIFINENILTIIKPKSAKEKIGEQDLIYVAGLIDYMNDKVSSRIIETLFSLLKKDGRLIVGNVSKGNELMAYTEMLGEWYINYRDNDELMHLSKGIKDANKIFIDCEPETKQNIFLMIEK